MLDTIPITGDLILAPMDGFSDLPFRWLCRQFGSAISYTVFVNAMEILHDQDRAWDELFFVEPERPLIFQLFDHEEDRIIAAAQQIETLQPDAIDINMGCSVRRVSRRGAGAGLLRDPLKIARIIERLTHQLSVPITAKIRLGWDEDSLNYLEVARAVADHGGKLIAVHARTRQQAFRGEADWEAIAEIKQAVAIPVIGNGDVRSVADIARLLRMSNCDGIMIGRAAIGNPWIFARREKSSLTLAERASVIQHHLRDMLTFYGASNGVRLFRKHLTQYILDLNLKKEIRQGLMVASTPIELWAQLSKIGLVPDPSLKEIPFPNTELSPLKPDQISGLRAGHSFILSSDRV